MVNVISLAIVAVLAVAFLGLGGVGKISAFASGISPLKDALPTATKGGTTLSTAKGSQKAIESLGTQDIIKTSITSSRKNQKQFGIIDDPSLKSVRTLSGKGTAQFSTGQIARLTPTQRKRIREKTLTPQEQRDIIALEARRDRAISRGINPNVKRSGKELVLAKREQEAISKQLISSKFGKRAFVDGKLFANPLFASGGGARRDTSPTIGKQGQIIENLGAGGSAIIRRRTQARVETALAFNRRVIAAKKAGLPIPVFGGF